MAARRRPRRHPSAIRPAAANRNSTAAAAWFQDWPALSNTGARIPFLAHPWAANNPLDFDAAWVGIRANPTPPQRGFAAAQRSPIFPALNNSSTYVSAIHARSCQLVTRCI